MRRTILFYSVILVRIVLVVALSQARISDDMDVSIYHEAGRSYAWSLSHDEHLIDFGLASGTQAYALYTGWFYALFGAHPFLIMLANSMLAAFGSFLLYSILIAIRPGCHWSLKLLVLADPAMLYWTSIHGKDPLVFFCLCLSAWAIFKERWFIFFLALLPIALIRPHIAMLVLVASAFAVRSKLRRWSVALVALSGVIALAMLTFSDISPSGITLQLSAMLNGLSSGGSALDVGEMSSVTDLVKYFPFGVAAVLFRPLPWESGSISLHIAALAQLAASFAAVFVGWRYWKVRPKLSPAVKFLFVYCLGFVVVFALISGNLGTLARQRVQFTPFLWLLAAWVTESGNQSRERL